VRARPRAAFLNRLIILELPDSEIVGYFNPVGLKRIHRFHKADPLEGKKREERRDPRLERTSSPRPVCGERIEVKGIQVHLFRNSFGDSNNFS